MFRRVEAPVGDGDQRGGRRLWAVAQGRAAHAHGHRDLLAVEIDALGSDQRTHALAGVPGAFEVDAPEDDRKFLAPVAGEHIFGAHGLLHGLRHVNQHSVARRVSVGVVDALEVIEVEHHQRHYGVVAARVGDLDLEPLFEVLAVVAAGQRVAHRRFVELVQHSLLARVGVGVAKHHRRPELEYVAVVEHVARDLVATQEGAVGAAHVLQRVTVPVTHDASVLAAHTVVGEHDARLGVPSQGPLIGVERKDLPHAGAVHAHQDMAVGLGRQRRTPQVSQVDDRRALVLARLVEGVDEVFVDLRHDRGSCPDPGAQSRALDAFDLLSRPNVRRFSDGPATRTARRSFSRLGAS